MDIVHYTIKYEVDCDGYGSKELTSIINNEENPFSFLVMFMICYQEKPHKELTSDRCHISVAPYFSCFLYSIL